MSKTCGKLTANAVTFSCIFIILDYWTPLLLNRYLCLPGILNIVCEKVSFDKSRVRHLKWLSNDSLTWLLFSYRQCLLRREDKITNIRTSNADIKQLFWLRLFVRRTCEEHLFRRRKRPHRTYDPQLRHYSGGRQDSWQLTFNYISLASRNRICRWDRYTLKKIKTFHTIEPSLAQSCLLWDYHAYHFGKLKR